MAIGGFGRAELNPHSDIDFMFLHEGQVAMAKPLPYLAKLIDGVLYPLWDIGLKIGYSVRDLDDCVKVANTDMQSKTSLIESRLIVGSETLFGKFQKAVVEQMRRRLRGKIHRRCGWKTRPRAAPSTATPPACRSRTSRTAAAACAIFKICCG